MTNPPSPYDVSYNGPGTGFVEGVRQGFDLIFHHTSVIIPPTLETLRLALFATALGTLIGIPCGALLGLGRSRSSHVLLVVANAMTRFPPVAAGVVVVLLVTPESPWGAVTIIGGNSTHGTATLASQILNDMNNAVHPVQSGVEHLIVLLSMMLALGLAFTLFQQWDGRLARRRGRRSADDMTMMEVVR